jgi:hypothetical protein
MSDGRAAPEPTELVYVPRPSWVPVLFAAGLAGVFVGLFAGLPFSIAGAIVLLASLRAWTKQTGAEISRLPRHQRLTTAVLPPTPLRRLDDPD